MSVAAVKFDPVKVAEFTFGVDLWDTPAEILRSVFTPHSKTFVQACHSSSKTHTSAVATVLAVLLGGDVVTTAPTDTQVEKLLWKDVHRVIGSSRIPPSEWGTVNLKDMRLPTGETAFGFATKPEDDGVRFQGFHARPDSFLLLIVDEALGVAPSIFTAIEGIASGGDVRRLYLCNPTIASGPVYDIARSGDSSWKRIRIDAFDTPNLRGLTPATLRTLSEEELDVGDRPYLVTRRWVKERLEEWGEDHPSWKSRVRGMFSGSTPDSLIALEWIEAARDMKPGVSLTTGITVGLDVAGPGENETVMAMRRGRLAMGTQVWAKADPRQEVIAALRALIPQGLKLVNVDSAGIGWYFYCDIRDAFERHGVTVNAVNVGLPSDVEDSKGNPKYLNRKAEYYWALREMLRDGQLGGNIDDVSRDQLTSIKYSEDGRRRIVIEKKEDARKRGVDSPDRAEAWMLTAAPESYGSRLAEAFRGQHGQQQLRRGAA